VEDGGASQDTHACEAVVDVMWDEQAETRVVMLNVVPREEVLGMSPGVLDGSEAFGKVGAVLERLEVRLGERIVVRDMRPASESW
jgi:hypothetical protein